MEYLVILDEKRIMVRENIDYIQILWKHKKDDEKHLKVFEDGDLVLRLPKDPICFFLKKNFLQLIHFE
jgi:hypothetical protein